MRTLTKEQTFHYILTYHTSTLVYWYNNVICEPYGDYSEQCIRDYDEHGENSLKDDISLETLMAVGKNPATNICEDDLYLCLTGGETPYLISFNRFEQFLNKMTEEDRNGFLDYLCEYPENLESLEEVRLQELKRWQELDKKEEE